MDGYRSLRPGVPGAELEEGGWVWSSGLELGHPFPVSSISLGLRPSSLPGRDYMEKNIDYVQAFSFCF